MERGGGSSALAAALEHQPLRNVYAAKSRSRGANTPFEITICRVAFAAIDAILGE
jgi:hypothetical protein